MKQKYHHWQTWECFRNNFYGTELNETLSQEQCKQIYADFLSDSKKFIVAMNKVTKEWPISSEQFLTNKNINRIAWLGQAAACIDLKLSNKYRSGFYLLSKEKQNIANYVAEQFLKNWIKLYEKQNT